MLKTHKRWVSLLVAVVMVAGLLVPFVGPASAACTYGATTVMTVIAGAPYFQSVGTRTATFDVPTWDSINATNGFVYASLPVGPLSGYAFALPGFKLPSNEYLQILTQILPHPIVKYLLQFLHLRSR